MKHTLAIALNDLKMRLVERDTLIFSFLIPVLFTIIMGVGMDAAFGGGDSDPRLPVAVVDEDGGALAMKTYGHLRREHSIAQAQRVTFTPVVTKQADVIAFPAMA